MPLKVRCRCGQELNLKYSEWVYVGIVLVLFAVLANTTALIVLLVHLKDTGSTVSDAGSEAGHAAPAAPGSPDAGSREPVDQGRVRAGAAESGSPPGGLPGKEDPPAGTQMPEREPAHASEKPPGDEVPGDVEELPSESTEKAESPGDGARGAPVVTTSGDQEPSPGRPSPLAAAPPAAHRTGPSAVDTLLEQLRLRSREGTREGSEKEEGREDVPPLTRPVHAGSHLIRLLILRAAEDDLLLAAGFFLDPEPLVRLEAMERVLEHLTTAGVPSDPSLRRKLEYLAGGARKHLVREDPGSSILELLDATETPSVDKVRPPEDGGLGALWRDIESRAASRLASLPDIAPLATELSEIAGRGADILLLIDTTKSMEGALGGVQSTASWLLPGLEWGAPGSRVGVLLYKDEVEEVVDLSSRPGKDVLPHLLGVEATGGGDVPEGVFTALKAALELGRVDWREEAEKHIIIVGDQPSPYDEKRAFESLASASHEQGEFTIHTLGVNPPEGNAVPFFADFARAGGGHHATCTRRSLGVEMLVCILGSESRPLIEEIRAALEPVFTDGR